MEERSQSEYTYYAFISYKREDEKWAKWLQKKLESYGFPVGLRKDNPTLPSKIRPIFRDQTELAGGNLKKEIEKGLKGSKYLIVVCSPRSAQSPWVSKEVQYFIDNGREEYIVPFIIGGSPNAKDPEEECFPESLRLLLGEKEILGININEMGRDAAAIKVIARMFCLRFDTLWHRHERAKRHILIGWSIVAAVVIIAITSLAIFINSQNLGLESKNKELESKNLKLKLANDTIIAERDRANAETFRANSERDRANRERDNALRANNDLAESNRRLAEERDNVLKANWKMMENQARSVAARAMVEVEKGNVYESIMALLTVASSGNEKPYVPEVEQALRLAYEKYSTPGWIHTELDGYYDYIYLTPDEKYLICESQDHIDILKSDNNVKVAQIKRNDFENGESGDMGNWGSLSSKDGSELYVIDGDKIRLYNLEKKEFIKCENNISGYFNNIHFPKGVSRFENILTLPNNNGERILAISPNFNYYFSCYDNDKETYKLSNFTGETLLTWNALDISTEHKYRRFLNSFSFSPNEKMFILSYEGGYNEMLYLNDTVSLKEWRFKDPDEIYYRSNTNIFADNNRIVHTSWFEDKIKIFDACSFEVIDSIYYCNGGVDEFLYTCMNNDGTKLWMRQLSIPIVYQRLNPNKLDLSVLKSINFNEQNEIKVNDRIIYDNGEKIECRNKKNILIWTYQTPLGSSLLDIFDNGRMVVIADSKPRGGSEIVFIDINSGKELYRNALTETCLVNNENSRMILTREGYEDGYCEVVGYNNLISACQNIVSNKIITQKGKILFNLDP